MLFLNEREQFEHELDLHYAAYPSDLSHVEDELDEQSARHPEWLPYRRKAMVYEVLASRCPIKLFRHFPFYFELDVGKPRTDLGAGGIGAWMKRQDLGRKLMEQGQAWLQVCGQRGLSVGWPVLDDNHHALGHDNVFRYGLDGLIAKAEQRLETARTEKERAFLESVVIGCRSQIAISERFAAEAERMLADEHVPDVRRRLERIAKTAAEVPARPPATFFEALNTILFMREVTQSLEGNGISVFAHLDRILWPYYTNDLDAGRLTRDEAEDLLSFFLAFSDVRFGMRRQRDHNGTNTTVMIGGCDARGNLIFNDLTRMVVELYGDLRLVDPKLNARISSQHPRDYYRLLADLTGSGSNSLCIFNDDVIIEANRKMGKALEDCRLYVGGGCQENVLENTEINSRATIYLNLLHVLLMGFSPEGWRFLTERDGVRIRTYHDAQPFERFYETFLENLKAVTEAHIAQRNATEALGAQFNPCPLHSATLDDCVENAEDMMEGGARYSYGSVALTGIGTLIDSLFAVREVVFRQKRISLRQLGDVMRSNFEGEEAFRQYLVHRVSKFGRQDEAIRAFSAEAFADLARVTSGQPNTRGGVYEASLFAFRSFVHFGHQTGATPDGRRAGEHLSAGMSPSVLSLGEKCSIGQVLSALEPLDLSVYPVVAVLDLKLPLGTNGSGPEVIVPVIERFVRSGGSVVQINTVDPSILLAAREHPDRHPDLVVRVSGYSAYFSTLSEAVQTEIIDRTLAEAGA